MFFRALIATAATALLLIGPGESQAWAQHREDLGFSVEWGGARVATLRMLQLCPERGHIAAGLAAKSLGVATQLHPFNIRLDSIFSSSGSTRARTRIREEGLTRTFRTLFDSSGLMEVEKTWKGRRSVQRYPRVDGTHDLLSWLFVLRSQPIHAGKRYAYRVWDGWKMVELTASIRGRERVWLADGIQEGWAVELMRRRVPTKPGKDAQKRAAGSESLGTIWLSVTDGRLPIAMDFRAPIGKAKIRLLSNDVRTCGAK
jgi:hypothetical protein